MNSGKNADWRALLDGEYDRRLAQIQHKYNNTIRLIQIAPKSTSQRRRLNEEACYHAEVAQAELRQEVIEKFQKVQNDLIEEFKMKSDAHIACEKVEHAREDAEVERLVDETVKALQKEQAQQPTN